MAEGKLTTRERAERAVERQLEKLVNKASFKDEHIARARETLRIRIASEEFDGIVEVLWDSYMPDDLRALTEGNMDEFSRVEPRRLDWQPTEAVSLTDELFALRFFEFSHTHHTEGKYTGEGHIYIGFGGEGWPSQKFDFGITAELAHHILHTEREDAHLGISELYDHALSWWTTEGLPEYFDPGCIKLRLAHFLTEHKGWDADFAMLAEQAATEILSTDGGRYELLSCFFGADYLSRFIESGVLPTPDNIKYELINGPLFRNLQHMSWDKAHTTGNALAWELLLEIERLTGLEAKGIEAHYKLTDVVVQAMYDDVDFTSPERYIETIKPRLPEYLNNG